MHLNYSDGSPRHGVAAPFDQLFFSQAPDFDALKGDDRVWALFDLSQRKVRKQLSDRPEWTAFYYPAAISRNQVSVRSQCKRVIWLDKADGGTMAIVPAEAPVMGKSFPGLVQVSCLELSSGVRAARGGADLGPQLSCVSLRLLLVADC